MAGGPTPKVLLVDDRKENILVLRTLLREMDVELLEANSGAEALEMLLRHEVAVALVDVQMPEMDGFELAELMRGTNRTSAVPIIFVTAGAAEKAREFRGYHAGAVDFLFKPLIPQFLVSKVKVFAEMHRQRGELARTLRLNEELVAVVSHDLRNPLNSILMATELMAMMSQDPELTSTVAKVERSAKRMHSIINDLLDLSRARLGGGIPVFRERCDLLEVAKTTTHELSARTASEPSRVLLTHDGDLVGEWDSSRLGQVLSNLVANALKHGLPTEKVHLELNGAAPDVVTVRVSNAGHIPPAALPSVFEPFVSGRSRAAADGLGLGLYIVRQLAEAHGGTVAVRSEPHSGTCFELVLPRTAHSDSLR